MLKKLILTVSVVTVAASCGDLSRRQEQKKQEQKKQEYKKIADYVIAYYIKEYIDIKTGSNSTKNIENYDILKSNTLDAPVSQDSLENVINKLPNEIDKHSEWLREKVSAFYNSIKSKREFSNINNKDSIIDYLVRLPEKYREDWTAGKKKMSKAGSELQNILDNADYFTESSETKSDESNSTISIRSIIAAIVVAAIAVLCRKFCKKRQNPNTNSEDNNNNPSGEQNNDTTADSLSTAQSNEASQEDVEKSEEENDEPEVEGNLDDNSPPSRNSCRRLYADAITDDFFYRVRETPDENTVYELNLRTPETTAFTVYRNAEERVVRCHEFLNGCDKQVIGEQHLKIKRQGEAVRQQADGKWRIVSKLNVLIS